MDEHIWSGVYTAIVTPFHQEEEVDYVGLRKLIREQIKAGVRGIVVVGTTGESPTLNVTEHLKVVETAVEEAAGKIQVIAGTGSNDTRSALDTTRGAHELGVDGFLQVGPYYNKPSQEGIYEHFARIADSTDKPIMLYSIPGRSAVAINTSTVARLRARFEHVNCIKEAGGSCDKVSELIQELGESVTVLSGDDALTLPFMSVGAKGVVSVTSNLLPAGMVEMVKAALNNDFAKARSLHHQYFPLFAQLLSMEPNPVCIKYALEKAGKIDTAQVRLPLTPPSLENQAKLDVLLQDFIV